MIIKGTTSSGYNFEFDDRIKKDWRFLQVIGMIEKPNTPVNEQVDMLKVMFSMILPEDKGEGLMEHVAAQNDGYMDIEIIMKEVSEILEADPEIKK